MAEMLSEAHAYAVETLWNRGGQSERWGLAMEMGDVRQPLSLGDAEQLLAEMVDDGHASDAVRLVALATLAAPVPHPAAADPSDGGGGE